MFSSNPFAFNTNQMVFENNFAVDGNPNQNSPPPHHQMLPFLSPPSFLDHGGGDEGFLINQFFTHLQQEEQIRESGSYPSRGESTQRNDPNKSTANNVKPTKASVIKKRGRGAAKETTPRKRKGKKDRHSKIYTAQGPRDRRMRLSLQVARKFFDLQDILGFDKASKTVEWLFTKSISAIKELADKFPGANIAAHSTSESEVVSEAKEIEDYNGGIISKDHEVFGEESKKKGKSRKIFQACNSNPIAKESREKARERARKRTEEKLMKLKDKDNSVSNEANPNEIGEDFVQELKSSSRDKEKEHKSTNHLPKHQLIDHSAKFFSIRGHLPRTSAFGASISKECDPVFAGNWDLHNDRDEQVNYNSQCGIANNMKLFSGNFQAQNPSPCFMISSSLNPNPNSTFMDNKNIAHQYHRQQQNPNSNAGSFVENLFEPGNPTSAGYKFRSLYGQNLY